MPEDDVNTSENPDLRISCRRSAVISMVLATTAIGLIVGGIFMAFAKEGVNLPGLLVGAGAILLVTAFVFSIVNVTQGARLWFRYHSFCPWMLPGLLLVVAGLAWGAVLLTL